MSSGLDSVATPALWGVTVAGVVALLAVDFVITRKPHLVSMREAVGWSAFYIALPLAFTGYVWTAFGAGRGLEYLTGYLVEKSLSVDNLFVFMVLLAVFAVPEQLQQRVLLYGIIGALCLRAVFIALGAAALARFDWAFLAFGLVLVISAVRMLRGGTTEWADDVAVDRLRTVRMLRRVVPVTSDYRGFAVLGRVEGRLALTPFALVVVAVFCADLVFAVDSVPAVYGVTGDPYLVFVTNAFALLGLRALYFVLHDALRKVVHLDYGLALILAFIGVKLALHWAHLRWPAVPEVPTLTSLVVILAILLTTVALSLWATRSSGAVGHHRSPPRVRF